MGLSKVLTESFVINKHVRFYSFLSLKKAITNKFKLDLNVDVFRLLKW